MSRLATERLATLLGERRPRRAVADQVDRDHIDRLPTAAGREDARRTGGPAPREPGRLEPADVDPLDDLPPLEVDPIRRPLFTRRHLMVVVALVALGLVGSGWALLRARPVAIASPAPVVTATSAPSPVAPSPTASERPGIVVHVLGAVRRPGLVELPDGSRVAEAIAEAGGMRGNADAGELNLAQVLADGEQIVVGTRKKPVGEVRGGGGGGSGGPSGAGSRGSGGGGAVIDLNRATQAELETLPGVGPVTAAKIIAWRTEQGRFSRVEELQEVSGIGPKTYAEIAPHVRV